MKAAKVYVAIAAISAEFARTGINKLKFNSDDEYRFRGIDDIVNVLSPLLARYKLCILPRVLEHSVDCRRSDRGEDNRSVTVRAAFEFVSAADGSQHSIEVFGEAWDSSDKATSKAMTAAYKVAVTQVFCIPISPIEDPDSVSPRKPSSAEAEPVQGWVQWTNDVLDSVRCCETIDAVSRVQTTYRNQLRALALCHPTLFARIGEDIHGKKNALTRPTKAPRALNPEGLKNAS